MLNVIIIHWQPGTEGHRRYGATSVVQEAHEAAFDAHAPYGYSKTSSRALEVDAVLYPLHQSTPEAGYPVDGPLVWTLEKHEAAEEAEEAVVMSLTAAQRELLRPDYVPVATRRAKRAADDAEAAERARAEAEHHPK